MLGFHRLLFSRLAIALILFSISRLLFYSFNAGYFSDIQIAEVIKAFIYGVRFDLCAVLYLNLPVVLLHLIPITFRQKSWWQKMTRLVFMFVNGLGLLVELIDIEYFPFTTRRMLPNDFAMSNEADNLLVGLLAQYWHLLAIYVALMWLLYIAYQKTEKLNQPKIGKGYGYLLTQIVLFLISIPFIVIGLRGGLQIYPLMPAHANIWVKNPKAAILYYNSTIHFIFGIQQKNITRHLYFPQQEADSIFNIKRQYLSGKPFDKKNVVFIIMESLSKDLTGYFNQGEGLSPNLDSIIKEGLIFENGYANGTRSAQGVSAILGSIPVLMTDPYPFSTYLPNKHRGLAYYLDKEGYSTSFFHGAHNGSMFFDGYSKASGFKSYYGFSEYEKEKGSKAAKENHDGDWGIKDEVFYDFFIEKLDAQTQPFLSTYFTITPHAPYFVSDEFKAKHPKVRHGRDLAYLYGDYLLGKFFEKVSNKLWFDNTLFVIVSDHIHPYSDISEYNKPAYRHSIPIVFYQPSDPSMRGTNKAIITQTDLMPTILAHLGYDKPFTAFGRDVYSEKCVLMTFENGIFHLTGETHTLTFDGKDKIKMFDHRTDKGFLNDIYPSNKTRGDSMLNYLKAAIQTHDEAMLENKLIE